jgi:hypothetical protein
MQYLDNYKNFDEFGSDFDKCMSKFKDGFKDVQDSAQLTQYIDSHLKNMKNFVATFSFHT